MLKNYIKIAIRSLARNKVHSTINIAGLSVGMAVAMLIGLWISDELSYDAYNKNYERIARVMQNQSINGNTVTWGGVPYPLGAELRRNYGGNFKYIVTSTGAYKQLLASDDKRFLYRSIRKNSSAVFALYLHTHLRYALPKFTALLAVQPPVAPLFHYQDCTRSQGITTAAKH